MNIKIMIGVGMGVLSSAILASLAVISASHNDVKSAVILSLMTVCMSAIVILTGKMD